MKNSSFKKQYKRRLLFSSLYVTVGFILVIGIFFIIGLLFPLRPSYSNDEKRELQKFPAFSLSAIADGSFFDDISAWYSDTFPFRSFWISENGKLKNLYGFSGQQIHGEITDGDEIPEPGTVPSLPASTPANADSSAAATETVSIPDNNADVDTQALGSILIAGDSGYEIYNFVTETAARYTGAVNHMADALSGKAKVYDMIVPTSVAVTLPDNIKKDLNSSDQQKAIAYMTSLLNDKVTSVEIMNTLLSHRDEYIYFRTDHHWNGRGAYYGYQQFAKAIGKQPVALEDCTPYSYDNFLGSFYADTGKNAALTKNPDTLEGFLPKGDCKMTVTQSNGKVYDWPVIYDVSDYPETLKYSAFIAGDNPYTVIENRS